MATPKKQEVSLLDELEKSLAKLMRKMENDPDATLTDKMKVADRILKVAMIKLKINDEDESSGFDDD